jgi:hypothetical protein
MNLNKLLNKNKENEKLVIGILSIMIVLWVILYALPDLFVNLFETILGKVILLVIVLLVSYKNKKNGIILCITLIVIYRFANLSNKKEGFTWNNYLTEKFLKIQNLQNPDIIFDPEQIQKQVSKKELMYFIENKKCPWSKETEMLYINALNKNPYIRTEPLDAINTVRSIYNEKSILEMLSWQEKEGNFLLKGVSVFDDSGNEYEDLPSGWGDYAYNSNQIKKKNKVFKCGYDKNGEISMVKVKYMGNNGITGAHTSETTPINYNDLERNIPGFKFINSPCNPCEALNDPPNYNCPFTLNLTGTVGGISPVWKYLWGLTNPFS